MAFRRVATKSISRGRDGSAGAVPSREAWNPARVPGSTPSEPGPSDRDGSAGFTLLEVLIALLVAMIGLMGTVAVQMTVANSSKIATDGAVALRLATQSMEEFNTRLVRLPTLDLLKPIATGAWTAPVYLDVNGAISAAETPTFRWSRRSMVLDRGIGLPYNVSVEVSYAAGVVWDVAQQKDVPWMKVVRLDMERRKQW